MYRLISYCKTPANDTLEALALRPSTVAIHNNLGTRLLQLGRPEEALAEFREAIHLDPHFAFAHNNLSKALFDLGRHEEALAASRKGIRLDPKNARAHADLGKVLCDLGQREEALAACREAIRLDPRYAIAHHNLGNVLQYLGRREEALTAYQEAIRLDGKLASLHFNLGILFVDLGRPKEAEAAYREAVRLDPNYAEAHCNLGRLLLRQGQFAEGLALLRRGHELGSKRPGWRYPSAQWVQEAEVLRALDGKLSAVLKGEAELPGPPEQVRLAWLCQQDYKRLYRAAARLYAAAFAADAKLAGDMQRAHRYNAACAAALVGCGKGVDAGRLSDEEKAQLRQQALDWLQADLAHWSEWSKSGKLQEKAQARQKLQHWQGDNDLAGVRGDALPRLPDAEAAGWNKLWAEVGNLVGESEGRK